MTSVGIWPFQRKESCLKFVDESETILKHVFFQGESSLHTKTCNIWIIFTIHKYDLNHFTLTCSIKFGDKMIGFMGQSKLESC